jgi:hypothetical protein
MVLRRTLLQTRIRSNEGLCMLGPAVIWHVLRDNNLYRHTSCSCRKLESSCFKAVTCFLHPTGVSTCNKQGLNWLRQRMVFCQWPFE